MELSQAAARKTGFMSNDTARRQALCLVASTAGARSNTSSLFFHVQIAILLRAHRSRQTQMNRTASKILAATVPENLAALETVYGKYFDIVIVTRL